MREKQWTPTSWAKIGCWAGTAAFIANVEKPN